MKVGTQGVLKKKHQLNKSKSKELLQLICLTCSNNKKTSSVPQYLPLFHTLPINKPSYFGAPQWVISWAKATASKFPNQNVLYNTFENMISKTHSTNANTTLCCCCGILSGIHSSARITPTKKQAWHTKVDLLIYQGSPATMIKHVEFENTFTKRLQFKDHLKSASLVKHGTIIDSNLAMSTRSTRSTLKTQTNRCQHLSNRGLFIFGKSKWVLIAKMCPHESLTQSATMSSSLWQSTDQKLMISFPGTRTWMHHQHLLTASCVFCPGAQAVPRFVNFGAKWLAKPWSKVSRVFSGVRNLNKNHWSSGWVFQVVGFSGLNSLRSSDSLNSEC